MSPRSRRLVASARCFPRVSGNEPTPLRHIDNGNGFPRVSGDEPFAVTWYVAV